MIEEITLDSLGEFIAHGHENDHQVKQNRDEGHSEHKEEGLGLGVQLQALAAARGSLKRFGNILLPDYVKISPATSGGKI